MDWRTACRILFESVYMLWDVYTVVRRIRDMTRPSEKNWRMVRLRIDTVEALKAVVEGWRQTDWTGTPLGDSRGWDSHTSLDAIVTELLRRHYGHRNRRKVARAKKRASKATPPEIGLKVDGQGE